MLKHKSIVGALMALAVVFGMGCGATAHIEKDESVNFSKIRSFAWIGGKEKSLSERHSNSIIDANLKNTVSETLQKKGWVEDNRNPDVLLDYNIMVENNVKQQSDPVYTRPYTRYYYNPYSRRIVPVFYPSQMVGFQDYEIPYKEGTLTLHMIDADTNKLIWQGWSADQVDGNNLTSKEVQSSVKAILKKFNR